MAFPSVQGTIQDSTSSGVDVSTFAPTLPGSIAAGEGLLVHVSIDNPGGESTLSIDTGSSSSGWVALGARGTTALLDDVFWQPNALGGGSDTLVLTIGGVAQQVEATAARVSGHLTSEDPTFTHAAASTASPNPPSHAHAGGAAEDVLWFALLAYGNGTASVSSGPSGYSTPVVAQGVGTNGDASAMCWRQANGTSEDPGTWTLSASRNTVARTLSIRPAASGVSGSLSRTVAVGRSQAGTVAATVSGSLSRAITLSRAQAGTVAATVSGALSRAVVIGRSLTGTVAATVSGTLSRTITVGRVLTGTVAAGGVNGALSRAISVSRAQTGTVAAAVSGSLARTIAVSRALVGTVAGAVSGSLTRTIALSRTQTGTVAVAQTWTLVTPPEDADLITDVTVIEPETVIDEDGIPIWVAASAAAKTWTTL